MNLRPLGERVVIKMTEAEGIVLPGSAKEQPQVAEIVAVGADILNDEDKKDQVKVGDKIIFARYAGTEIKLDGEELTVLKLEDVLAVIE